MPISTIGSAGLTSPLTGMTISSPTLTTPNIDSAQIVTVSGTAPLYMARAWVNFNGTGTVAIRASGNVTSITDNGTGDYTVNFTTAMPDANYCVIGSSLKTDTDYDGKFVQFSSTANVVGSARVCCDNASTGGIDRADSIVMQVSIFR